MWVILIEKLVTLSAPLTCLFFTGIRWFLWLVQVQFQIDDSGGHLEIELLDELRVAVFKLSTSTLFICDFYLELLAKTLLILPHLLHRQSESLFRLNRFSCRLSLICVPPLVKIVREALKVGDQSLNLGIGPISLVLKLFNLLLDKFAFKVELILQLEQLVRDRAIMLRCAFLLALAE